MFDLSLMAGLSRGFTLLMPDAAPQVRTTEAPAEGPAEPAEAAATLGDLIAALRFPMAPGWILQGGGHRGAVPRGCG